MADNYQFIDANSSIITAGSSAIGSVHYPVVKITSVISVQQSGTVISSISGNINIAGSVLAQNTVPSSLLVGASIIGAPPVSVTFPTNQNVSGSIFSISRIATTPSVVQGTADLRVVQGGSVAILAAPGAGISNYVKHVQIANFGPSSVLVTIADNTTSILGYSIAPAGSGSNYDCFYKAVANSPITASINGTASVLVSAQGFTE